MKIKARPLFYVMMALSICFLTAAANATHKLQAVKTDSEGVSKKIADLLEPTGYRIMGPKGAICDVSLVKSLAVRPGFKPALNVKYPFTSGQLIGVLRVSKNASFTDFRGQELKAGVYTLRYGIQPEDGNHIGTSEVYDFLLALPAKIDQDPKPLNLLDEFHERSAKSAGSTHPAIFSLLPAEKRAEAASLSHDEDHDFWILNVTGSGKEKNKSVKIPIRIIVLGQSEA